MNTINKFYFSSNIGVLNVFGILVEKLRKHLLFLFVDCCTEGTWIGSSLLMVADAVVMETTQQEIWKPLSNCCYSPTCQQYSTDSVPFSVYPFELHVHQKRCSFINVYMWFPRKKYFSQFISPNIPQSL